MANQLNIGLQRQSYEAFEAVDSDTENQNTYASLADDSADTNTGGNPTTPTIIGSPQVEGENGHQAPPETVAANNMLNRYGISDCIIIQRPEYAINNRAAPAATPTNFPQTPDPAPICPAQTDLASLRLETSAQVGSKPLKKPLTGVASYAKDAANTAPVTSHGTKLPPRDSVAYTAAREYGAQHGYDAEQTNQLAALFAYYHCETPQHCKDMLDSLPFHIATIMQAIGGARADGTFDVGLALRGLQETQVMMNGDPNAANEHLSDLGMLATASGGGGALGAVHGSTRAGEGQGAEDYANEMSMASSTGDATYFDYGDESYDAADNVPPPNPEPLPSLPSVEATGPIMLLLPDIHLDNELLPIPTIEIAANQSASTLEGAGASTSTLSTRPEDNPNFMGYNTNGQSLFADPATQRYAA